MHRATEIKEAVQVGYALHFYNSMLLDRWLLYAYPMIKIIETLWV